MLKFGKRQYILGRDIIAILESVQSEGQTERLATVASAAVEQK